MRHFVLQKHEIRQIYMEKYAMFFKKHHYQCVTFPF